MQKRLAGFQLVIMLMAVITPLLAAPPPVVVAAEGFANSAFRTVWTRTDLPVEDLSTKRSWLWGPQPLNVLRENYANSPGGARQVQYFDKSRMEINDPGNPNAVTNGLLARELISGQLQTGDATFEGRAPGDVNVAGDPDDTLGPTYASLGGLLSKPPLAVGTTITETLNRDGTTGDDGAYGRYGVTAAYFVPETNHIVASVFWEFLNQSGPVQVGTERRTEKLFEPTFFATGLPISRPYWARVKVANQNKDVLIQAFERRVLTYTPDNPEGFKVEMGNVGRHYYKWRYGVDPTAATARVRSGPHIGYGFNGFFTFNPTNNQAEMNRSLDLVTDAGFGWIRQQVVWATLEPQPGQFDIEQIAMYDAIVREAARRNLRIMFSVSKAPRWAVSSDGFCHPAGDTLFCGLPQDPQTLASVLRRLAERYRNPEGGKYASTVAAFEVWNEQNTGGETGGNIEVGAYIEQLKASYTAVKGVDDRFIIVYGGLTPTGVMDRTIAIDDVTYLEQSYLHNNGEMRRYFDVMGAHPGSNNNPPDAMWPSNPGPGTGCAEADGNCWRGHESFYFRRIEQLRSVMEKYGDANKQVWLTEFGWTTKNEARGYEYGSVISEELQAQYIVRAFEKGKNDYPWMGVMFLWTLNHSVVTAPTDEKYPWSVIRGDWSPRPSYLAVKAIPK